MTRSDLLYVGVQGSVVAYEKSSGRQVWSRPLKSSSFVNVILDGNYLFAHTSGELFALDAATGTLLWQDGLTGYGYGMATLVTENAPINFQVPPMEKICEEQRQQHNSAASVS